MPPKKADPQTVKKEFEAWLQSEEYKKMEEVHKELKGIGQMISETSVDSDLSGKFQTLWDLIYEFAVLLKIKPPFKRIQHEWIRSMFFGEKKKEKAPYCTYDGVICQHENIEGDSQHNLRQVFIKYIYNILDDIKSIDESNYIKIKSDLKKAYTDFFKQMKAHLKKSFKLIYEEKLMQVLQPLVNLLEINMKMVMYDLKYETREERIINGFKYKAYVDKYSKCLQQTMKILSEYHSKPIKYTPDVRMIFKKLDYENLTKIEEFYIEPLKEALEKLKRGLASLFTTGVNFWKVPLQTNRKFVEDLKSLINEELIAERLFGNELLRDQINFIAQTIGIIQKANPLAEKFMLQMDPNAIQISIPRLVAFRTIQHMRNILDRKEEQRLKGLNQEEKQPKPEPKEEILQNKSVGKSTLTKDFGKTSMSKEQKDRQNQAKRLDDQQRKKYGRYWIWVNYCDEQHRKLFEECVEMLRHINKAVHQDIEDYIIREGMLPNKKDRQNQQLKVAAEQLKNMKTTDNAQKVENMKRPPELWNYPKIIEENHRFRSIADPKKSYIDGRVEDLDRHIVQLAEHLRTKNKQDWDQLIKRVIDFYANNHDSQPHF